jgi:hypothetical protein
LQECISILEGISRLTAGVDVMIGDRLPERLRDCIYQILSASDELRLHLLAARLGAKRGGQ